MVTPAGHRDAGSLRPLGALLTETYDVLRRGGVAGAQVWPTAFPVLDATLTGGFRAGELVLLGGPAGHGKTTLGLQMARNVVAAGSSALVFSYEHDSHTLLERFISMEAAEGDPGEVAGVIDVRLALENAVDAGSLDGVLGSLSGGTRAQAALVGVRRPAPDPRVVRGDDDARAGLGGRRPRHEGDRAGAVRAARLHPEAARRPRRGERPDHRGRRGPQGPRALGPRARPGDLGRRQGGPRVGAPDA